MEKTKACSICKEEKSIDEFYSYALKNGSMWHQTYCKKCNSRKTDEWNAKNPERRKEIRKNQELKPDRIIYLKENAIRQRQSGQYKQWQENNRDKLKEYNLKRFSKRHVVTPSEWDACKKYFNDCCAYCGIGFENNWLLTGQDFHRDHYLHDGLNDLSNCIPACKSCNCSKHTKRFEDWYVNHPHYNVERIEKIQKWLNDDWKNFTTR